MTALAWRVMGWVPVRDACGESRVCGEVMRGRGVEIAGGGGIVWLRFSDFLACVAFFNSPLNLLLSPCLVLWSCRLLLFAFLSAAEKTALLCRILVRNEWAACRHSFESFQRAPYSINGIHMIVIENISSFLNQASMCHYLMHRISKISR